MLSRGSCCRGPCLGPLSYCSWGLCWCLWPVSPQGTIGTKHNEIRRPCWVSPILCRPWSSLAIAARELAFCTDTRERWFHPSPWVWTADPDGMGIGKLTLPLAWGRTVPGGLQPGSVLAHPNICPSRTCWSSWRHWSCGMINTRSPWLRAAVEYSRRVSVRIWQWWCTRSQALNKINDSGQWTFARKAGWTMWHTAASYATQDKGRSIGEERNMEAWRGFYVCLFSLICLLALVWLDFFF